MPDVWDILRVWCAGEVRTTDKTAIKINGNFAETEVGRNALLGGLIPGVLKFSLHQGKTGELIFDVSGMRCPGEAAAVSQEELLEIMKRTVQITEGLMDYLIFPEDYELDPDRLWIAPDGGLWLMVVPESGVQNLPVRREKPGGEDAMTAKLVGLLDALAVKIRDDRGHTLRRLRDFLLYDHPGTVQLISFIDDLKAELRILEQRY